MNCYSRKTKSSLRRVFAVAAVSVAGMFSSGCDILGPDLPDVPAVPLTEGEIDYAHTLFSNWIDPYVVRKYFTGPHDKKAMSVRSPESIIIYGENYYSDDYSLETGVLYSIFAHELTHIWQRQNDRRFTNGDCDVYDYSLYENSRFTRFCVEQQAAIIEDYVRRFVQLRPFTSRHFDNKDNYEPNGGDNEETDRLLQSVVEDIFPWLEQVRMSVAIQRILEDIERYGTDVPSPAPHIHEFRPIGF